MTDMKQQNEHLIRHLDEVISVMQGKWLKENPQPEPFTDREWVEFIGEEEVKDFLLDRYINNKDASRIHLKMSGSNDRIKEEYNRQNNDLMEFMIKREAKFSEIETRVRKIVDDAVRDCADALIKLQALEKEFIK